MPPPPPYTLPLFKNIRRIIVYYVWGGAEIFCCVFSVFLRIWTLFAHLRRTRIFTKIRNNFVNIKTHVLLKLLTQDSSNLNLNGKKNQKINDLIYRISSWSKEFSSSCIFSLWCRRPLVFFKVYILRDEIVNV